MHDGGPHLLEIDDMSFRYPAIEGIPFANVLEKLAFIVDAGEISVLLAPADAGKTTLARIIAGLVPRFTGGALDGSLRIAGRDGRVLPPYELLQNVGLVAQDSDEQLITTRCDTEVAFALESLGISRTQMREQVARSLAKVGLSAFADRNPANLSGGEKKRLLVACLDAIAPDMWILDEALGELDYEWKARVLDLLSGSGVASLVMESRWSGLVARRGSAFSLLKDGRISATTKGRDDRIFQAALGESGMLPAKAREPRPDASTGFIRARGLDFHFDGFRGFNLSIESLVLPFGEICALLGRNGSGKSTLGKILCGLLRPGKGSVEIGGPGGISSVRQEQLCARVGYLFQNPDHQIYLPTVREELGLGLRRQHVERRKIETSIQEAASIFCLPDLSAPPALLSYGARRRLQAATFFLLSRNVLILDEIDSGLSYHEVESLVDALASRGSGIVLITHDMALAKATCQRILLMEEGRITADVPHDRFDSAEAIDSQAERP